MVEQHVITVNIDAPMNRFEQAMERAARVVDDTTRRMERATGNASRSFTTLERDTAPVTRALERLDAASQKAVRGVGQAVMANAGAMSQAQTQMASAEAALTRYGATVADTQRAVADATRAGTASQTTSQSWTMAAAFHVAPPDVLRDPAPPSPLMHEAGYNFIANGIAELFKFFMGYLAGKQIDAILSDAAKRDLDQATRDVMDTLSSVDHALHASVNDPNGVRSVWSSAENDKVRAELETQRENLDNARAAYIAELSELAKISEGLYYSSPMSRGGEASADGDITSDATWYTSLAGDLKSIIADLRNNSVSGRETFERVASLEDKYPDLSSTWDDRTADAALKLATFEQLVDHLERADRILTGAGTTDDAIGLGLLDPNQIQAQADATAALAEATRAQADAAADATTVNAEQAAGLDDATAAAQDTAAAARAAATAEAAQAATVDALSAAREDHVTAIEAEIEAQNQAARAGEADTSDRLAEETRALTDTSTALADVADARETAASATADYDASLRDVVAAQEDGTKVNQAAAEAACAVGDAWTKAAEGLERSPEAIAHAKAVSQTAEKMARDLADVLVLGMNEGWDTAFDSFEAMFGSWYNNLRAQILAEPLQIATNYVVSSMPQLFGISAPQQQRQYVTDAAGNVYPVTGPAGGGVDTLSMLTSGLSGGSLLTGSTLGTDFVTGSIGQFLGLSEPTFFGLDAAIGGVGTAGYVPVGFGNTVAAGINAAPWGVVGSLGANMMGFQGSGDPFIDFGLQGGGAILGGIGGTALGTAIGGTMFGMTTGSILGPVGAIGGAFLGTVLGDTLFGGPIPSIAAGFGVRDGEFYSSGTDSTAWDDAAGYMASAESAFTSSMSLTAALLSERGLNPDMGIDLATKEGKTSVHWAHAGEYDFKYVEDMAEASLVFVETLLEAAAKDAQTLGSTDQARYIQRVLDTHEATTGDELAVYFQQALAFADDFDAVLETMVTGVVDYADSARSSVAANLQAAQTSMEEFLDMAGDLLPGRLDEATEAVKTAALAMFGLTEESQTLAPELLAFIGELQGVQDEFANVMGAAGWTDENISEAGYGSLAEAENEAIRRSIEEWLETVALTQKGADALEEAFGDIPGILDLLTAEVEQNREDLQRQYDQRYANATRDTSWLGVPQLMDDYQFALDEAAAVGLDAAVVTRTFTAEIANAAHGLDNVSLYELMTEFSEFEVVVDGLAWALQRNRDAARQAAEALEADWRTRLLQVTEGDTLEGQLELFDRQAQQEYIDAASNGYADLTLLEETLAAERLRLIERYYEAEANERAAALQDTLATWREMADLARSTGESLRAYLDGLQGGTETGLSPAEAYANAQALLTGALGTIASSDDEEAVRFALGQLTSLADQFLTASELVNAGNETYAADRLYVTQALDALADALGVDDHDPDAEMTQLLEQIRANTGFGGPLAKDEALSDRLNAIFGGAGSTSYLYKLMQSSDKVADYTDQIADLMADFLDKASNDNDDDDWLDDRQWAAPGYEQHIPANYALAQATGYAGDFGGGGFDAWIIGQDRATQMEAAQILLNHGQSNRIGWAGAAPNVNPNGVLEHYQAANNALRAAIGYTGSFGSGGFAGWIVQQTSAVKDLARQLFYAYGQPERIHFASGGWIRGPGGPRDDMVPLLASAGEFMVNADAAQRWAPLLEAINDNRVLARPLPALASPAPVLPGQAAGGLSSDLGGLHLAVAGLRQEVADLRRDRLRADSAAGEQRAAIAASTVGALRRVVEATEGSETVLRRSA